MRPLPKVSLKLLKKLLPSRRRRNGNNVNNDITNNNNNASSNSTILTTQEEAITNPIPVPTPPPTTTNISPKPSSNTSLTTTKKRPPPAPPVPPEECPICHDPVGLENPEGIIESWTSLFCGHRFGTHCIQTWLTESLVRDPNANPSCPICRTTAKHPCGHLISPPPFPSIELNWQAPRPPPPPPMPRLQRQLPVRRRLTRRPGHPLRPPPPPPPPPAPLQTQGVYPWNNSNNLGGQRVAQTVGECKTCAENAEFAERMRRNLENRRRQNTAESSASGATNASSTAAQDGRGSSSRKSSAATAIKAIIPGLKRSSNTFRATVVHVGVEPHHRERDAVRERMREYRGNGEASGSGSGSGGRQGVLRNSVFCTAAPSARAMPRRPTPPPGYSRRLSI
ncbi:uncharacterized protein F4822DRAFT_186222 [Hypoxylon trugodes]|uniref:uncharacterized protein n=1 Tax=Hypoxylon trugodes TaxID=326681 RepID=UPI00219328E5|nr:uncharacterized protein F4822DRAFT_186222 [Hypoxylon trugodes]KAI1391450.1 hypothetical protein F4822DRAFT_186222 [Hypoxylon trugodes]